MKTVYCYEAKYEFVQKHGPSFPWGTKYLENRAESGGE